MSERIQIRPKCLAGRTGGLYQVYPLLYEGPDCYLVEDGVDQTIRLPKTEYERVVSTTP